MQMQYAFCLQNSGTGRWAKLSAMQASPLTMLPIN